jgi:hypothetical protein
MIKAVCVMKADFPSKAVDSPNMMAIFPLVLKLCYAGIIQNFNSMPTPHNSSK